MSDSHKNDERVSNAEAPAVPARRKRSGLMDDPMNRKLVIAAVSILVLWLAGVASALVLGMLTPAAPRTQTERALRVYENAVAQGNVDPAVWADYTRVLISVGQYYKADKMIDQALKNSKGNKSPILAERARLDAAQKNYDQALKSCDVTLAEVKKEMEAERKKLRTAGMGQEPEYPRAFRDGLIVKGDVYTQMGEPKKAVKTYDTYLKQYPTAADVLVLRAGAKARIDDRKGAEADYRLAMRYVPDYDAAIAGLKKIGADVR